MLVKSKSSPEAVDRVEQVIASLPVTVKEMVAEADVAAERASVTVDGAVVSTTIALFAPSELAAAGVASTGYSCAT